MCGDPTGWFGISPSEPCYVVDPRASRLSRRKEVLRHAVTQIYSFFALKSAKCWILEAPSRVSKAGV
jgi:hypothetical protein